MTDLSRRAFVAGAGTCSLHLALAGLAAPPLRRAGWARRVVGRVVAAEPFGRLEEVAPGIWALISTPLAGDYTTVANGGIIAGSSGVLAIEGFMRPTGAAWLAGKARELTGTWPTHVVVTHYHGDHVNGVAGYTEPTATVSLRATAVTSGLARERNQPADDARTQALAAAIAIDPGSTSSLDLGGRVVRIVPRAGHTASDLSLELDEPSLVFAGDLVWNAMFPNYMDATPSLLERSVRALRRERETLYVPGHGALARAPELDRYLAVLGEVGQAARQARARGLSAADGAKDYRLPASLGEWVLFNPRFMETAFTAWYRELGG